MTDPPPSKASATPIPLGTSVNQAAGVGQPVTQIIAVTVKGDSISCSINNKVVATHPRSEVVAAGKLKSTDAHYGLRFGHNTDATVTDFKKQRRNSRSRSRPRRTQPQMAHHCHHGRQITSPIE